jgi:hypothetical protein
MDVLQVSWVDPSDPVRGFNDIAIPQSDAEGIMDSIAAGRVLENGTVEISSIVGTGHGLGVENLMGSGLIAGEPPAAYDETFTLTYVVARSVGIGENLGSPWAAGYPEGKRGEHNSHKFLSAKQRNCSRLLLYLSDDQRGVAKNMDANGMTFALHAVLGRRTFFKHVGLPNTASGLSFEFWQRIVPRGVYICRNWLLPLK